VIAVEIRITDKSKSPRGWCKPSQGAKYAGNVTKKQFYSWLKHHGLPHIRLPNGRILIAYDDIDQWLRRYQVSNKVVDELVKDF